MGLGGLEPPTSRLSGVRSNQLSYRPTPRSDAEEIEPVETVVAPTTHPRPEPNGDPGLSGPGSDELSPAGGPARLIPSPKLQKRERIAHGPESPGGRPRISSTSPKTR